MQNFLKRNYFSLIIISASLLLVFKLFNPGWYATHDGIFHIYRTQEALSMLKLGHFPLRWAGNFDQGFGIPLFSFVYPLPYYLSAVFSTLFGTFWALKVTTIMAYVLGALGFYQFFAPKSRSVALVAALIYLLTPYQFLNIFVRGTIGETLAIGLMPWVLLSMQHLSSLAKPKLANYHPLPLALVLLSHNFLGILFAVFLIGFILTSQKNLKSQFVSLFLSFALASFFLLPMILQKDYLYSFANNNLTFRFDQHFVSLKQLLYGKWDYWYSVPGDGDGMSFQLGIAQIIFVVLGTLAILIVKPTLRNLYLVLAYLSSLFLMHSSSFRVWQAIPLLGSVQFPWRFLFMPLLLTPFFVVAFLTSLKNLKLRNFIAVALLILAFVNVRNYRSPMKFFEPSEYTDLYLLYLNKTSTTFRTEILPKWSVENERYKTDEILVNAGNMTIESLSYDPLSLTLTLNNKPDPVPARVTILRNYYPGWVLTDEVGERYPLTPTQDGMIQFEPSLSEHTYQLRMKSTKLELISNTISALALLTLLYLWQKNRHTKS